MLRLHGWAMELAEYNIIFIHIKGSKGILADAVSGLKIPDIYKDPIKYSKKSRVSKIQVTELNMSKIHTLDSNVLHAEQK